MNNLKFEINLSKKDLEEKLADVIIKDFVFGERGFGRRIVIDRETEIQLEKFVKKVIEEHEEELKERIIQIIKNKKFIERIIERELEKYVLKKEDDW